MLRNIARVQFSALSPQEWERYAIRITTPYTRGGDMANTPYDPRLGVLDNGVKCPTCNGTNKTCDGHFGVIPLVTPVWNLDYIRIVLWILKCVCLVCHEPLISPENAEWMGLTHKSKQERLRQYFAKCENIPQCSCGTPTPTLTLIPKNNVIKMSYGDKEKATTLTAEKALAVLMQISDATMTLLGFNDDLLSHPAYSDNQLLVPGDGSEESFPHVHRVRPESFIFTLFPVIPPHVRPWVLRNRERRDDDLTEKYNMIIKVNNRLREDGESAPPVRVAKGRKKRGKLTDAERTKLLDDLSTHIWSLIDNTSDKAKTGRTLKGLHERISGKEGHCQSNVAGKRADQSSRSVVVGGGPLLPLGWVGMPEYIANILTVPEPVTKWNMSILQDLLEKGQIVRVKRQGLTINVQQATHNFRRPFDHLGEIGLLEGDIAERKYRDGDVMLFNRQPTLRIESMQGVRVKIMWGEYPWRLGLAQCRAFNADFDGDEMNGHACQSLGARAECATVMAVSNLIVSRQSNSPIMGLVQNSLITMYLMTNTFPPEVENPGNVMIGLGEFFDCLVSSEIDQSRYFDLAYRARKLYPQYIRKLPGSPHDMRGVDGKKEKGDGKKRPKKLYGFTDPFPGKLMASIVFPPTLTWSKKTDVNPNYPVFEIVRGVITPTSGPICKKIIGAGVNTAVHLLWATPYSPQICSRFITEIQYLAGHYLPRHGFSMGISDCLPTRLDEINQARTLALAECEMILGSSTLSHADQERGVNEALNKSMGVAPRLAKTSMNKGERNGLVIMKKCGAKGTDINNGQISGYVGQQNIDGKRMPMTLANNTRTLSCFAPGDRSPAAQGFIERSYLVGLNPSETWFHAASGRRGVITTALGTADTGYGQKKLGKKLENCRQFIDGSIRDSSGIAVQYLYAGDGFNPKYLVQVPGLDYPFPMNPYLLAEVLNNETRTLVRAKQRGVLRALTKAEIQVILERIQVGIPGVVTEVTERATYNCRLILKTLLTNPKLQIYEMALPHLTRQIVDAFEMAKSPAGEAVGLIASSSIGEPTTQQNLSMFHSAGQSAKDVTLGIPRFKELLNGTKNPSKPTCTVALVSPIMSAYTEREKKLQVLLAQVEADKTAKEAQLAHKAETLQRKADRLNVKLGNNVREALSHITFQANKMVSLKLGDLLSKIELKYLPSKTKIEKRVSPLGFLTYEEYEPKWWVTLSQELGNAPKFEPESWVLELSLNLDQLYLYQLEVSTIAEKIEEDALSSRGPIMTCVASPNNLAMIEVYLNFGDLRAHVRSKVSLPLTESERPLLTPKNLDYFTARDVAIDYLKKVPIQGLKGISKAYPRQDLQTKEWLFDTQGTSFREILATPGVDPTRTISDDMWEIYEVLGIEATRSFLIKEMTRILSFDGTYVNPRHVVLLVESMTLTGTITSVSRYGIHRNVGPVSKGIFEKPVENFAEAAAFSERDTMESVASAVMFGTTARVGTGPVDIKDAERLPVLKKG